MSVTCFFIIFAGALVFLVNPNFCQNCNSIDTDVLILGGGMAGVAAANYFHEEQINFILVDAQGKLGGRIKNLEISPGIFLTEGASFIQGIDENVNNHNMHTLLDLASTKFGGIEGVVVHSDADDVMRVYNSSGSDVTEAFCEREGAYLDAVRVAQNYSRMRRAAKLEDETCRQGLDRGNWVVETSLDNFTDWEEFDFCIAATPDMSSLYGDIELDTYRDFNSQKAQPHIDTRTDYFITDNRGYLHLVDCLAKPFEDDRHGIRLNTTVNKINNMENCVCITTTNGNFCGKYAILTFSIGVIKSMEFQESVLTPAFSANKLQALEVMTMAHYLKIYVVFDRRFWDTDVFFVGYIDEVRGYYPLFLTMKDLYPKINVTIFVVTGDMALKVVNQNESTTQEEVMAVLESIYNISIPSPQRIYIEKFSIDPLFLGSYSNILKGLTCQTFHDLSSPEGRLYFAGEGYSEKYNGFVHGAYFSGIQTAENLSRAISDISRVPDPTTNDAACWSMRNLLAVVIILFLLVSIIL